MVTHTRLMLSEKLQIDDVVFFVSACCKAGGFQMVPTALRRRFMADFMEHKCSTHAKGITQAQCIAP